MEDYDIQQINGQLHIVIKNSWDFVELENCEICVQFLPPKMTAQEVFDLFTNVGKILKLRLLMEFSGLSRGTCYINFFRKWQVEEAIDRFNHFRLYGRYLQVFKSNNFRMLMIGNMLPDLLDEDIRGLIRKQTDADFVYVFKWKCIKYCLIRFPKHQSAVIGRRILISKINQFGPKVYLRWYKQ